MTTEINSIQSSLVQELAALIVESVNLHHVNPGDLNAETVIAQGGLNLDSVDILEVVVAIEQKYKVKIKTAEEGQAIFQKLGTLADFVSKNQVTATA